MRDDLGGGWLDGRDDHGDDGADDELGAFLRDSIPGPAANYWDQIDERLAAASDQGHTNITDIGARPSRPTAMDTNQNDVMTNGRAFGRPLLAAAAALLLLLGVGVGALAIRGGDDDPVGVATAPETEAPTATVAPTDAADEDAAAASQLTVDDAANDTTAEAGPLTAVQAGLSGQGDSSAGPYCFAATQSISPAAEDGPPSVPTVVLVFVATDGSVSFEAIEGNQIAFFGQAVPDSDGRFTVTPTPLTGLSGLPPYEFALTDTALSVGAEAVFPLVDCAQVESRLDALAVLITDANDPLPSAASAPLPPADAVLSSAGLGPIRIGMTVSELSAELGGEPLEFDTIDLRAAGECGWVDYADGIWILVELTSETDAIIRRVSVFDGPWLTPSGIGVGATEQTVRDTFPAQLDIRPHIYVDGNYLTFVPSDANDPNTVEFVAEVGEFGGQAVIAEIRAGDRNWVSLVEGCA